MTVAELQSIVTETSGLAISEVLTLRGKTSQSLLDFFDPSLMTYDGLASLDDGTEIAWGLSQASDSDLWDLTFTDPYTKQL